MNKSGVQVINIFMTFLIIKKIKHKHYQNIKINKYWYINKNKLVIILDFYILGEIFEFPLKYK